MAQIKIDMIVIYLCSSQ